MQVVRVFRTGHDRFCKFDRTQKWEFVSRAHMMMYKNQPFIKTFTVNQSNDFLDEKTIKMIKMKKLFYVALRVLLCDSFVCFHMLIK